jgi:hypothetical protein
MFSFFFLAGNRQLAQFFLNPLNNIQKLTFLHRQIYHLFFKISSILSDQSSKIAIRVEQLYRTSNLSNLPLNHKNNLIILNNRIQPMRNCNDSTLIKFLHLNFLNNALCLMVNVRSGLVHHQYFGLFHQRARDAHQLPLTLA